MFNNILSIFSRTKIVPVAIQYIIINFFSICRKNKFIASIKIPTRCIFSDGSRFVSHLRKLSTQSCS
jgi:hypothetical protein